MTNSEKPAVRSWAFLVAFLLALPTGVSAQKPPDAGYVFPPGGKAGTTVELKLGGYDWVPDQDYFLSVPGATLAVTGIPGAVLNHEPPYWFGIKSYANDPPLPREVTAKLTLPADMPPGPFFWRVANANGSGNAGVFIVSDGDEILENRRHERPQELTQVPTTISGCLGRIEETDVYRFQVTADTLVTCDLTARRLGSDFHGVIEVRDDRGHLIADVVDTEGHDPVLTFAAKAATPYFVSIHDLDFRGYRSYVYRLTIALGPRVLATLPAVLRRGETRPVAFLGIGLTTGEPRVERVTRDVTSPGGSEQFAFTYRVSTPHGTALPFCIPLSDVSDSVESTTPSEMAVPFALTCLWDYSRDRKSYTLRVDKAEAGTLSAHADRLGSPLDLSLSVRGPDGKELAQADDVPGTLDPSLTVNFPAPGLYRLDVTNQSPPHEQTVPVFRLVGERPRPDFTLQSVPVVNVPTGGTAPLVLNITRTGGFKEPVALTFEGLPAGVEPAKSTTIEPTAASLTVKLQAAKDAPATASLVKITGTATIDGHAVTHRVKARVKANLAPQSPEDLLVDHVLVATTIKPPFKVTPVEADGGRRVNRGATYFAELNVTRDAGFDSPIVLDMAATQSRHRQGIGGPVFTIPPATPHTAYPVTVPEWLETNRTSRLALVAMAHVPDGKGRPRTVLSPVAGQITMSIEGALLKLSHTTESLTIRPGQSIVVPLTVARSPVLTEPVQVELVVPEEIEGLATAASTTIAADQSQAECRIETKAAPGLIGRRVLTLRAVTHQGAVRVSSETSVDVEFR